MHLRIGALVGYEPSCGERKPTLATARNVDLVRHEQKRRPVLAIQAKHQVGDLDSGVAVEIAGGLVGHQDFRLARERARDGDALLLAA